MFGLFSRAKKAPALIRAKCGVRLEAIGGQGANSAGKIIAEAAVLGKGYNGNHFSSFGSEKRGSPVSSFVRFTTDGTPVRSASAIRHPDVLGIFHESLLESHPAVIAGASGTTTLVINSPQAPGKLRLPEGTVVGRIFTLDASAVARKLGCGLNAPMLGALVHALPEIPEETLRAAFQNFFGKLNEKRLQANLAGFAAGLAQAKEGEFQAAQSSLPRAASPLPRLGYLNAPIGGMIANPGNTVLKDNSASRIGIAPRLNKDLCFHCGYCDLVCPDYCFVWKKNEEGKAELQGIDYQFCKGCQKCVVACPVEALTPVIESEIPASEHLRLFPQATAEQVAARWKNMDWAKAVEEMTPEARMLTLQSELLDPKTYLRPSFPKDPKEKK